MKIKKVLSAISALAISVSAFAGMAVTANAYDQSYKEVYSENFESGNFTFDSQTSRTGVSIGNPSEFKASTMNDTDNGKVLQLGGTGNSDKYYLGYKKDLGLSSYNKLYFEFDVEALSVRSDGRTATTYLQFADTNNDPILKISVATGRGLGMSSVIAADGNEYKFNLTTYAHVALDMDFTSHTQNITVTDKNGSELLNQTVTMPETVENFGGFYLPDTNWAYGYCLIDNIKASAPVHTVTVNYIAGSEAIGDLPEGTTTTYTVNAGSSFTPDYPKEFTIGDYKYTFVSSEPKLPVTVNSDTTITLNYEKTPVAPPELTADATFAQDFTSSADNGASVWTATLNLDGKTYTTIQATATDKDNNVKSSNSEEITTISGESTIIAYIAVNKAQDDLKSVTVTLN